MDEKNTVWQPVEPTTPVSKYPYEQTAHAPNPYDAIPIPPPPPKKPRRNIGILLVITILVFSAAGLFAWTYTYHVSTTQPTPIVRFVPVTPTPNATATTVALLVAATDATATQASTYATATANAPVHTQVPVSTQVPSITTAQDIYTQFTNAGISMGNAGNVPNSWWLKCCSYYPGKGSISFTDEAFSGAMTIALFNTVNGAQTDAAQIHAPSVHPGYYLMGACLLLYWSSSTNLTPYEQVMNQYCV